MSTTRHRHPGRRIVAAVALLLRRWRTDRGVLLVVLLVAVVATLAAAAVPTHLARVTERSLSSTLELAPPDQRGLAVGTRDRLAAASTADPFERLGRRGATIRDQLPAPLPELLGPATVAITTDRHDVTAAPSGPPASAQTVRTLTAHALEGVEEHATIVTGRWPEPTGQLVNIGTERIQEIVQDPETGLVTVRRGVEVPIDVPLLEIAVTAPTARHLELDVGDRAAFQVDSNTARGQDRFGRSPVDAIIEVVGIAELTAPDDPFWFGDASLHEPGVELTLAAKLVFAHALAHPQALADVEVASAGTEVRWRYQLDPAALGPDRVGATQQALRELQATTVVTTDARAGVLTYRTGLDDLLVRHVTGVGVATTTIAIAAVAAVAMALLCVWLTGSLLAARRRAATALIRGRGGSATQLVVTQLVEAVVVAGVAAAIAIGVAGAVAGSASPAATLAVAGVAAAVVLAHVGSVVADVRTPLRELERPVVRTPRMGLRRRVAATATVAAGVLVAVAIRQRGIDVTGGVDPLAVTAPAIIAAAAAVGTVTLGRVLWPRLAGTAERLRGLVPPLALRQATRSAGLPTGVLVAAATVAVLAATVAALTPASLDEAAWRTVGADVRLTAPTAGEFGEFDLDGVPGVVATAGERRLGATATIGGAEVGTTVLARDTAAYAGVVAGSPLASSVPDRAVTPAGPIPVVVSRGGFDGQRVALGDRLTVEVLGTDVDAEVVALQDTAPGLTAASSFVVADLDHVAARTGRDLVPDRIFVDLADPAATDAVREAVATRGVGARLTSRTDVLEASRAQGLAAGVVLAFVVAGGLVAVFAALSVLVALSLAGRARAADLAALRALGAPHRQLTRLVAAEFVPTLVLGVAAGTAAGAGVVAVLGPRLDLSPFTAAGAVAGPPLVADPTVVAIVGAALALLAGLVVVLGARLGVPTRTASILREGDAR